jgi:hypothetical protein
VPLPPSPDRVEIHHRRIDMRGYQRSDGLYEVDARVVDRKTHPVRPPGGGAVVPPGEAVHDMSVRVLINERLDVLDIVACTDASPYSVCPEAAPTLALLKGARIGPGWTQRVKETLGGVVSCTHLMELMIPLGTAAFQTLVRERLAQPDALDAAGRPRKIDSCYAYASHRPVVLVRWPEHYTGDAGSGTDSAPGRRAT